MVKRSYWIREDQDRILKDLPNDAAETIRKALDEYFKKNNIWNPKASVNPKGGVNNG